MKVLGYGDFIPEIQDTFKEHKTQIKSERVKKISKIDNGMSLEEMEKAQEEMFEMARKRYQEIQSKGYDPIKE